jgi:Fe-S-cluster containining protein
MIDDSSPTINCQFKLDIEGHLCTVEAELPDCEITLSEFLPIVWRLQGELIGVWTQLNAAEGKHVSCRAGCGACCRQLVPISEIEAHHLDDVIQALPQDHRERVLQRFASALNQLTERAMLGTLEKLTELSLDEKRRFGLDYFRAGIACPFLEHESCSIHADRPSACREYLVTSPAIHCASMSFTDLAILRHSAKFSSILFTFSDGAGRGNPTIVPLMLALRSTANDDPRWARKYPALQLFEQFLNGLATIFSQVK